MPDLSSVNRYFPTAQEAFTTALNGTIAPGAVSVPLQSTAGYTNGDTVVFVVEPGTANQQVFTGIIDTGGSQVTSVKWTEGTNATHNAGSVVVDYVTATDMAMSSKGILIEHTNAGIHRELIITSRTEDTAPVDGDFLLTSDVSASNALKKVQIGNLPRGVGSVVQVVNTQTGAVATGTTLVPVDDTIPQNTEGDQYMTLAITPKSATNLLLIEVVAHAVSSVAGNVVGALFQDSTAGALAASYMGAGTSGNIPLKFTHKMTAGTVSATTFKVRIGGQLAGTITFNGLAGARFLGGVLASSITITEIKV